MVSDESNMNDIIMRLQLWKINIRIIRHGTHTYCQGRPDGQTDIQTQTQTRHSLPLVEITMAVRSL